MINFLDAALWTVSQNWQPTAKRWGKIERHRDVAWADHLNASEKEAPKACLAIFLSAIG
jgi:hypothetical protein